MTHTLTPEIAARFAEIALGHVTREYPHKLDHVMATGEDVRSPRDLHPIFFGSFDWHSCVHGYWLLMRLRWLYPDLPVAARIDGLFAEMLTPDKVAVECDYLKRPASAGFERPYGWAWLLALHRQAQVNAESAALHGGAVPPWAGILAPLAAAFAERFTLFLPKLTYPIRTGTHFNTAFALILALDWAEANDPVLAGLIRSRATDYYAGDAAFPAWEPSGDDFLSPGLTEALCMRRVLSLGQFLDWFDRFLPHLLDEEPRTLFTPAFVSDRSDGKIAHLDGLNLSRAWCWRAIAGDFNSDQDFELSEVAHRAAERHLDASLPHVAGDYMGEHWLATFALLAIGG
jgi:hypothetical protein